MRTATVVSFLALSAALVVLPSVAAAQADGAAAAPADTVLAVVRGDAVRLSEVEEFWRQNDPRSFRALNEQLARVRGLMLSGTIAERLLRQEATRRRVTLEELVEEQAAPAAASPAEIQEMYARSSASQQGVTLDMARPAIAEYLQRQKASEARRAYAEGLRSAAGAEVVVLLEPERIAVNRLPTDPVRGSGIAGVEVVEFSDFECPFCAQVRPVLDGLLRKYAGRVRLVWKDLPLPSHPSAVGAASAARCAGEQASFWEYHDVLFANQQRLTPIDLVRYAIELGLDVEAFRACFDSGRYQTQVMADGGNAVAQGVSATPTVVINGRSITGVASSDAYERAILEEIHRLDPAAGGR